MAIEAGAGPKSPEVAARSPEGPSNPNNAAQNKKDAAGIGGLSQRGANRIQAIARGLFRRGDNNAEGTPPINRDGMHDEVRRPAAEPNPNGAAVPGAGENTQSSRNGAEAARPAAGTAPGENSGTQPASEHAGAQSADSRTDAPSSANQPDAGDGSAARPAGEQQPLTAEQQAQRAQEASFNKVKDALGDFQVTGETTPGQVMDQLKGKPGFEKWSKENIDDVTRALEHARTKNPDAKPGANLNPDQKQSVKNHVDALSKLPKDQRDQYMQNLSPQDQQALGGEVTRQIKGVDAYHDLLDPDNPNGKNFNIHEGSNVTVGDVATALTKPPYNMPEDAATLDLVQAAMDHRQQLQEEQIVVNAANGATGEGEANNNSQQEADAQDGEKPKDDKPAEGAETGEKPSSAEQKQIKELTEQVRILTEKMAQRDELLRAMLQQMEKPQKGLLRKILEYAAVIGVITSKEALNSVNPLSGPGR